MLITYTEIELLPKPDVFSKIESLYGEIFTTIDHAKFGKRVNESKALFTIIAYDNHRMIGFKMGYAIDDKIFYSWIGGVLPEYRQHRVAQALLEKQHAWCKQQGFQTIRTKTMNRWIPMLILNLKNGFEITNTYTDDKGELKIVLEKRIS